MLLRQPLPFSHSKENFAIISVAPRSFWKSSSRSPTERGITLDYLHVLHYALNRFPSSRIVIYGHSLGGAAAVCMLARLRDESGKTGNLFEDVRFRNIKGLILENPFGSIEGMVRALYPQRWVPYRYLAPLAFDKWDAVAAMHHAMSDTRSNSYTTLRRLAKDMLVFLSEKDEVVPIEMGSEIFEAANTGKNAGKGVRRKIIVRGALHENAWDKHQWLPEMKKYLGWIESIDKLKY